MSNGVVIQFSVISLHNRLLAQYYSTFIYLPPITAMRPSIYQKSTQLHYIQNITTRELVWNAATIAKQHNPYCLIIAPYPLPTTRSLTLCEAIFNTNHQKYPIPHVIGNILMLDRAMAPMEKEAPYTRPFPRQNAASLLQVPHLQSAVFPCPKQSTYIAIHMLSTSPFQLFIHCLPDY